MDRLSPRILPPRAGAQPFVPPLFPEALAKAHAAGQLRFCGHLESLREAAPFAQYLTPLRQAEWVIYAKPPFGGPHR